MNNIQQVYGMYDLSLKTKMETLGNNPTLASYSTIIGV